MAGRLGQRHRAAAAGRGRPGRHPRARPGGHPDHADGDRRVGDGDRLGLGLRPDRRGQPGERGRRRSRVRPGSSATSSRAVGQSLTLRFAARAVPRVSVAVRPGAVADQPGPDPGRRPARGRRGRTRPGVATWVPPAPVRADSVTVTVLATSGEGFGMVGISEVRRARRAADPGGHAAVHRGPPGRRAADRPARAALAGTPVDVVLTRARGAGRRGRRGDRAGPGLHAAGGADRGRVRAGPAVRRAARDRPRPGGRLHRAGAGDLDVAGVRAADRAGVAGAGRAAGHGLAAGGAGGRAVAADHRARRGGSTTSS